ARAPPGAPDSRGVRGRVGAYRAQQARSDPRLPRRRCGHRAHPDGPAGASCAAPGLTSVPSVYVAMGSNVEPERNLAHAAAQLAREFPGARFSPWFRNRAVGFEGEDFINLVAGFETHLPVQAVLEKLHAIEKACGRERAAPRWAPRAIDLDVLLYADLIS